MLDHLSKCVPKLKTADHDRLHQHNTGMYAHQATSQYPVGAKGARVTTAGSAKMFRAAAVVAAKKAPTVQQADEESTDHDRSDDHRESKSWDGSGRSMSTKDSILITGK
jgi:hypothetical protein